MRMRPFLTLCSILLFAISCDVVDDLTKFDMAYDTSVEIKSTTAIDLPFNVFTPDVETNSESEFAVNDTRKDLVEEVRLKNLKLDLSTPDDGDFSFLESIEIYISAEGLDEIQIASLNDIPEEIGNSLELDTSDMDLKEYIKKDHFNLRLNTVTDEALTTDHRIDVNAIFFVDAKILGI